MGRIRGFGRSRVLGRRGTALLAAGAMVLTGLAAVPASGTHEDLPPGEFVDQTPSRDGDALACSTHDGGTEYPGGAIVNPGGDSSQADPTLTKGTSQSFVPSIGHVDRIELCLTPVLTTEDVADAATTGSVLDAEFEVVIYQIDHGPIEVDRRTGTLSLVGATVAGALAQATDWYGITFEDSPEAMVFTPGVEYAIQLVDPSIQFIWRATCGGSVGAATHACPPNLDEPGNDPWYPRGKGSSATSAQNPVGDFGFRTISTRGPDLVGEVAIASTPVVCPDASTFRNITTIVTNAGDAAAQATQVALTAQGPDNATPIDLGTAPVEALQPGQPDTITFSEFSNHADVDQLAGTGVVDIVLTIDGEGIVTETSEANNVVSAELPIMACAEGALVAPSVELEGADNTIPHGITRIPFAELDTDELAAIAHTFGGSNTRVAPEDQVVEEGVEASPLFQSPLFQSPLFQSPLFQSSVAGSPLFQSPLFQSPLFQSPLFQSPLFQSPLFQSDVAGSPLFQSPLFQSPLFQSPLFQSPLFQSPLFQSPLFQSSIGTNLAVLLGPLPDELLDAIPVIMVPADWAGHLAAVGAQDLLDRPQQELTLLDMEQAGVLARMQLSDADFSKALRLDVATGLLGTIALGDLPAVDGYVLPDGTNDLCAILTDTTHLTCSDLEARYGSLADITVIELALVEGALVASLPFAWSSLADVDVVEDPETGLTGVIAFDTPIAHTGYLTAQSSDGQELLLPAQGHVRLFASSLGHLTVAEAFGDASVVDCSKLPVDSGSQDCLDATVAQVEAAYAFDEAVARDVGDLLEALSADGRSAATLLGLAPAFVPLNNLPWSRADLLRLDTPRFQERAGLDICEARTVTVASTVDPTGGSVFDSTLRVALTGGFDLRSVVGATVDGTAVDPSTVRVGLEPDDPYVATKGLALTVPGVTAQEVSVSLEVCAGDVLGDQPVSATGADWRTFVEVPDAPAETAPDWKLDEAAVVGGTDVTLVVVEDEEDVEGVGGTMVDQVNTLVVRHITDGDVDLLRVPTTGLRDADGATFDLAEGAVVIATLAPPPGVLQDFGTVEAVRGVNLDLAAWVTGSSDLVEDSFGLTEDLVPVSYVDPPAFPVADNTVLEGPNGTISPSPLFQSPLFQSPLFQSPLFQSDVEPSPLFQSPLFQSGYDRPARAISNNRGDAIEQVAVQLEAGEVGEDILLEVSGVLGASSDRSYRLWLTVLQPPARGQCDPVLGPLDIPPTPPGSIPSLAPGDETLVLFNPQVAEATYGSNGIGDLGMALADFVADPAVNGVVVNPMLDPDYDGAMRAWLTTDAWCSPPAANEVAGQVRRIVQQARLQTVGTDGEPTLKYVMVFGDDSQQPYWRIRDDRPIGNARELAQELFVRTGQNNPLLAAAAESFFVTDDPMVTSQVRLAGDRPIFLPDVVSARVIGDPVAMIVQLAAWSATGNQFESGGFELGDGATIVTGEGPFADGAEATADDLQLLGFAVDRSTVNEADAPASQLSQMDALRAAMRGDAGSDPQAAFMFQHTDPWRIQSAYGTATGVADLLDTDEVVAADASADAADDLQFGHVLAATNCNFNQQVPAAYHAALRSLVGGGGSLDLTRTDQADAAWADVLSRLDMTISWAAATSYGYGVEPGIDLTEELVLLTEQYTARGLSFGQAVLRAKQRQFVGQSDYDEYNYKALATFQVNGFPMSRQVDAAPFEPDTIFTPPINEVGDGVVATAALQSPDLTIGAAGSACTECLRRVDVAGGSYYTAVTDSSFGGEGAASGAPIVPQVSTIYDFGGRQVAGVLITAIESEFAEGTPGDPSSVDDFDFVYETMQLSAGDRMPGSNGLDVKTWFAPRVSTVGDEVVITSNRAQAKGKYVDTRGEVRGLYLLNTAVNGEITFVPQGTDLPANAALVAHQEAFRSPDGSTMALEWTTVHERPTHRAVGAILVARKTADDVPVDPRWMFSPATLVETSTQPAGDGLGTVHVTTWRSLFQVAADDNLLEHLTQTVDATGRVNFAVSPTLPSHDNWFGQEQPPVPPVPNPVVSGDLLPGTDGIYDGSATVTLDNDPEDTFDVSIDGSEFAQRPGGFAHTFTEPGAHVYRVKSQYGTQTIRLEVGIDTAPPTVDAITPFLPQPDGEPQVFRTYTTVPLEFTCADDVGIVSCFEASGATHVDTSTVTDPDVVRTVTFVAVDTAGRTTSVTVPYVVRSSLVITQFDPPIKGDFRVDEDGRVLEAQTYRAGGENTIPFKFEVRTPSGEPVGILPLGYFRWRLLDAAGQPTATTCQAYSNPGYHLKGIKHQFNAETACFEASGAVTRDFVAGEVWRFEVRLPDGLLIYADVTFA